MQHAVGKPLTDPARLVKEELTMNGEKYRGTLMHSAGEQHLGHFNSLHNPTNIWKLETTLWE